MVHYLLHELDAGATGGTHDQDCVVSRQVGLGGGGIGGRAGLACSPTLLHAKCNGADAQDCCCTASQQRLWRD